MSIKIGSFNIRDCASSGKRSDKIDLDLIATIIKGENFDIVGLQEIHDKEILNDLMAYLSGYESSWAAPEHSESNEKEGYAFIWNSTTVSLPDDLAEDEINPRIIDVYDTSNIINPTSDGKDRLARDPYFGRFYPKEGTYEIRLLNTHVTFATNLHTATEKREKKKWELEVLADIYRSLSVDGTNTRPKYLFLLGDYNMNIDGYGKLNHYLDDNITVKESDSVSYSFKTVQTDLTTLGRENNGDGIYRNNYDHFSYFDEKCGDIVDEVGAKDLVTEYCEGKNEDYYDKVSDHIPAYLVITLN